LHFGKKKKEEKIFLQEEEEAHGRSLRGLFRKIGI